MKPMGLRVLPTWGEDVDGEHETDERPAATESSSHEAPPPADAVDPRFPSGPWQGYCLVPPERCPQSMRLSLIFRGGVITGSGCELGGTFLVVGAYGSDGSCNFDKRYPSGHVVRCRGYHVDQGRYF